MTALEKPAVQRRGVLLPQHFERRDQYLEALLDAGLGPAAGFAWGIAGLAVDPNALATGELRISAVTARFPSGAIAVLDGGDAPLVRAIRPEAADDRPVDVFVGLPDASDDGPNASEDRGGRAATRYQAVRGPHGPILVPRLRLYIAGEDPLPSDRIRITQIRSTRRGVELDPDVLPPMLWPLEHTFLPGALGAIVSALGAKQAQLLAMRRERPHEPLNFSPEETPRVVILSAIQQALAALSNPPSGRGHRPWDSHRILSELLGAIDALDATGGKISPVPGYVHDAPGPGFRALVDRLLAAIPVLARPPYEAFAFTRRADGLGFELAVRDPAILRRPLHLVLFGGERGLLEQGVSAYAKLASDGAMAQILRTAVRGIELAPDFDPPASLPSSGQSACFRLNTRSEYWGDVVERGSLCFYLPNAPGEMRVVLYAMREGAA